MHCQGVSKEDNELSVHSTWLVTQHKTVEEMTCNLLPPKLHNSITTYKMLLFSLTEHGICRLSLPQPSDGSCSIPSLRNTLESHEE